jgi:hypothetical protein
MNHGPGQGQPVNVTMIVAASFAMTAVVLVVLFAVGILPLWLAAAVLLFDDFISYLIVSKIGRRPA